LVTTHVRDFCEENCNKHYHGIVDSPDKQTRIQNG